MENIAVGGTLRGGVCRAGEEAYTQDALALEACNGRVGGRVEADGHLHQSAFTGTHSGEVFAAERLRAVTIIYFVLSLCAESDYKEEDVGGVGGRAHLFRVFRRVRSVSAAFVTGTRHSPGEHRLMLSVTNCAPRSDRLFAYHLAASLNVDASLGLSCRIEAAALEVVDGRCRVGSGGCDVSDAILTGRQERT